MKHARNVAIVLAIAAAVHFLPGGGTAATTVSTALSVVFLGTIAWFGYVLFRQRRTTIEGLEDRQRVLGYAAIAVIVVTMVGTSALWETGLGLLLWFALIAAAAYALVTVYRQSREY